MIAKLGIVFIDRCSRIAIGLHRFCILMLLMSQTARCLFTSKEDITNYELYCKTYTAIHRLDKMHHANVPDDFVTLGCTSNRAETKG